MGITEPAIFGVNLRFFKPFIAGCIGGGCGALYASIVHLGASGTGVTGIFGILLCLQQPLQYLIEMAIAVGVAFTGSFNLYKDATPEIQTAESDPETPTAPQDPSQDATDSQYQNETLKSPVLGEIIPLSEVKDDTFASEVLGATVAISPKDGRITAPCDAEVSSIYDTGHAVCLTTKAGAELLIHIGIDTVKMEGQGFTKKVSDGDQVHAGDVLVEADLSAISTAGYDTATMVILTNEDEFTSVSKTESGEVSPEDSIMELQKS